MGELVKELPVLSSLVDWMKSLNILIWASSTGVIMTLKVMVQFTIERISLVCSCASFAVLNVEIMSLTSFIVLIFLWQRYEWQWRWRWGFGFGFLQLHDHVERWSYLFSCWWETEFDTLCWTSRVRSARYNIGRTAMKRQGWRLESIKRFTFLDPWQVSSSLLAL